MSRRPGPRRRPPQAPRAFWAPRTRSRSLCVLEHRRVSRPRVPCSVPQRHQLARAGALEQCCEHGRAFTPDSPHGFVARLHNELQAAMALVAPRRQQLLLDAGHLVADAGDRGRRMVHCCVA